MSTASELQDSSAAKRAWRRWATRWNSDRGRATRMRVVCPCTGEHDGRLVERLHLREHPDVGWWVQVDGRKWTRQHHWLAPLELRCHPDPGACGWSKQIGNAEMVAKMFRAWEAGRDELVVGVDL